MYLEITNDIHLGLKFGCCNAENRRLVQQGGFSINKEKINNIEQKVLPEILLNNKYILIQKGKKNFTLIKVK